MNEHCDNGNIVIGDGKERNPDYVSKCQNLSDFAHHGKEVAQSRIDPGFQLSLLRKDHCAPQFADAQLASRNRL
jgi:hypothetical protein